jgi:hypothetical protein
MRISKVLNPLFLFNNRARIAPYLTDQRRRVVRNWQLGPFENRHPGGRCFIIGNGPSLTMADLDKLKSELTFASNKIYLAFDRTNWRPNYYVVEDDHMIRQNHEHIRQMKGVVKFVNHVWWDHFRHEPETVLYPLEMLDQSEFPRFSANAYDSVYCGYMVTYVSLQLAFFMGFTEVYLLGVDFDYNLPPQASGSILHGADHPIDHFTSDYFKPGESLHPPRLDRAERAMICAQKFYEAHGRKIWNATRGGKLEVFERISLEQVLGDRV